MTLSVEFANTHIDQYVIDSEDWDEAESDKKQRLLNVAERTLASKFEGFVVPVEACFEFAAALAIAFNDTNRMNNHGVASFSITGVASFNFKDTQKRDLEALIPSEVVRLISEANDGQLPSGRLKWTVL